MSGFADSLISTRYLATNQRMCAVVKRPPRYEAMAPASAVIPRFGITYCGRTVKRADTMRGGGEKVSEPSELTCSCQQDHAEPALTPRVACSGSRPHTRLNFRDTSDNLDVKVLGLRAHVPGSSHPLLGAPGLLNDAYDLDSETTSPPSLGLAPSFSRGVLGCC